jgi:voltage-gated potassium channel
VFQPGATIVPAGDAGGAMYFIGSGDATVCVVPGQPIKLHEGDFFGEMALLEHRSHRHAVVADAVCRVYVLDSEGLARLGRRHPEIVRHIKQVAKQRALENQKLRRAPRSPRAKSPAAKKETEAQ